MCFSQFRSESLASVARRLGRFSCFSTVFVTNELQFIAMNWKISHNYTHNYPLSIENNYHFLNTFFCFPSIAPWALGFMQLSLLRKYCQVWELSGTLLWSSRLAGCVEIWLSSAPPGTNTWSAPKSWEYHASEWVCFMKLFACVTIAHILYHDLRETYLTFSQRRWRYGLTSESGQCDR